MFFKKHSAVCLLLILVVFSHELMADATLQTKLPDKFLGTFKLDRSENFDEFLASKGVNWVLRKMIALASVTKVFAHSEGHPDCYDAHNLSLKKDTHYIAWKLGEPFRAEGFDGKIHEITFDYNSTEDALYEKHVRIDNPDDKGETYVYVIDNEELVMTMKNDQVTCKRYFKRQ